jgi:hypothetical protein
MFFNRGSETNQPSAIEGLFNMLGITAEQQEQFLAAAKSIFDRFVGIDKRVHENALHLQRIEAKLDALLYERSAQVDHVVPSSISKVA